MEHFHRLPDKPEAHLPDAHAGHRLTAGVQEHNAFRVRTPDQRLPDLAEVYDKSLERSAADLVSTVAHELRSPLTPIRGFAQVVARDLTSEGGHETHVAYLETLQKQADRMTRLVDDLLDVSRISRDKLELRLNQVELASVELALARQQAVAEQALRLLEQKGSAEEFIRDIAMRDVVLMPPQWPQRPPWPATPDGCGP